MNEFSHSTYLNTPSGDPKSRILAKFIHSEAFFLSPKRGCLKIDFLNTLLFFGESQFSKKIRKLLKIFFKSLGAVVFLKNGKLTKINQKIRYNIVMGGKKA